ncbi:hypothetical protein [Aliivibrio kagoshimensis]|uniref:hypothetical protein n=1 Tax=Aliivibrio kagoshimensis TaxID=2910230 RepID=UPI003D0FFB29
MVVDIEPIDAATLALISKPSGGNGASAMPYESTSNSKSLKDVFFEVQSASGTSDIWELDSAAGMSGGVLTKSHNKELNQFTPYAADSVNIVTNMLLDIKEAFGINDEERAFVLQSARKSVHSWSTGKSVRKSKLERVVLIHEIAEKWAISGIENHAVELSGKKSDLLDLLAQDAPDSDSILFLGTGITLTSGPDEIEDPFA